MRERVGEIGVDAGLCWVGDPCYVLHPDKPPRDIGKSWNDFCTRLFKRDKNGGAQFNFDRGHAGLGVAVSTGYGDGCYPVYVEREGGRVARVIVEFMEPDENESDDE